MGLDCLAARPLVEVLWAYNQMGHAPQSADLLLILGTNDVRIADHAADLAHRFQYKFIVCSGGVAHQNTLLKTDFGDTEANVLADRMIELGVSADRLLREQQATNTGQNITCTRDMLDRLGVTITTAHMVQKPFMERRCFATACHQWPGVRWTVSSSRMPYHEYIQGVDEERLIHILVGDTYRILSYPALGYQIPQPMDETVKEALRSLIQLGRVDN